MTGPDDADLQDGEILAGGADLRDTRGWPGLPRLHAVTTREILERPDFFDRARAVLEEGQVALHLRARGANGRLLLECARALRVACPASTLVVNDRVDVARLTGSGAHLPERGLTPAQARMILGKRPLLGRSLHGLPPEPFEQDLDYVFYGHVFETGSKPGTSPRGLEALAGFTAAAAGSGLPVIAVGGVVPESVGALLAARAWGVAVVSGIWERPDPAAAAAAYLRALEASACV